MGDKAAAKWHALALAAIAGACAVSAAQPSSEDATLAEKIAACASCHGADGNSTREGIPSLAGQPELYLVNQLILIREGVRRSEVMRSQVRGFDDAMVIAIAEHFSALPPKSVDGPANPSLTARGRALAKAKRCGSCHLLDFSGRAQMPRLAGQREDYLAATLTAYRDGELTRTDTTMTGIMYGASDNEIEALAHFLAREVPRVK